MSESAAPRRSFKLFLVAFLVLGLPRVTVAGIEGYAYPPSVAQGEAVSIFVSTTSPAFDVHIVREGGMQVTKYMAFGLPGAVQAVPENAWATGCGWAPSLTVTVPETWQSGVYVAYLVGASSVRKAVFVVREDDPGSTADILFQTSLNTWQAYNSWGGKSLYDFNSTDGERAHEVSFLRPFLDGNGQGQLGMYELPMIRWLEQSGYAVEYCTSLDTHSRPGLEDPYELFLSVGHDEYWSREMRDNIESRIHSGRNVAFFGGNTAWWAVRYTADMGAMICYKDPNLDPLTGVDNSRITAHWHQSPLSRPENIMTGVSFRNAGYVNHNGNYPRSEGYGDYTAYHTDHWVFEGTGLGDGDEFGWEDAIVGYETDGACFDWVGGLPVVTGIDQTPMTFTILGVSPARRMGQEGFATMGVYRWAGCVFNAATTNWCQGLDSDPVVRRITRNVIDRLQLPAETVGIGDAPGGGAAALQSFPNPFRHATRIVFELEEAGHVTLEVYDIRGRRIASLADEEYAPGRHEAAWDGSDDLGRSAGAGVYFIRLRGGGTQRVSRVVRLAS